MLITRQILANKAANRWRHAYFRDGKWHDTILGSSSERHSALVALGAMPAPDDVDRIIGNGSWTRNTCSCCHKNAERVVSVDVTGGEYSTHICEKCVDEIKAVFT